MTSNDPDAADPDDELVALVALSLASGIGPKLQSALLQRFGSAISVLSQTVDTLLSVTGIGQKSAKSFTVCGPEIFIRRNDSTPRSGGYWFRVPIPGAYDSKGRFVYCHFTIR